MTSVLIGHRNLAHTDRASIVKHGLRKAISASASTPAANLTDANPFTVLEAESALPKNTSYLYTLNRTFDVGLLDVLGDTVGDKGLIWAVIDERFAHRPVLSTGATSSDYVRTAASISTSADFTTELIIRLRPWEMSPAAACTLAWFGTADGDTTADWRLIRKTDGTLVFRVSRYSASGAVEMSAGSISHPWLIHLQLTVASNQATLRLNGTVVAGPTPVNAHSSQVNQRFSVGEGSGACGLALARRWDRALSTAELDRVLWADARAAERGMVLQWTMATEVAAGKELDDAASGTITDTVGAFNGTIGGACSWSAGHNPAARYDNFRDDIVTADRFQQWRQRSFLSYNGSSGQTLISAATLSNSPSWSCLFTISLPVIRRMTSTKSAIFFFATTATDGSDGDLEVRFATNGTMVFLFRRGGVSNNITTAALADEEPHEIFLRVDGIANTAQVWLDGVSQGSASVPAYAALTSRKFMIAQSGSLFVDFDLGELILWKRLVELAEAQAWTWRRHPGYRYDPSVYLLYDWEDAAAGPHANAGFALTAGDLTVAGGPTLKTIESADPAADFLTGDPATDYEGTGWAIATLAGDAPVPAKEIFVQLFARRSSVVRLTDIGIWRALQLDHAVADMTTGAALPAFELSAGGVHTAPGAAPYVSRKVFTIEALTHAEAEAFEALDRLAAAGRSIVIALAESATVPFPRRFRGLLATIRGKLTSVEVRGAPEPIEKPWTATCTVEQISV